MSKQIVVQQGRELSPSPTHLRIHSPNVDGWEPDIRLLQSSSDWLSKFGLPKLKLTLEQILPTIGFKHSDDYVKSLKKPVAARYSNGLFSKVPHKSGTVYNLIATQDKLRLVEVQLSQAINTYKKRLEWLTSESRRIFGVVEERSVAIVLDVQAASRSQLEMFIQSLIQVLKEQVMFISKFNLIRSCTDMLCWQDQAVSVTVESIDSALTWLLKQAKTVPVSSTSLVEAILHGMADDQVEAVYLYTEGSSADSSKELLKRKAKEYRKPLHVVSINCCSPATIAALKELAKETNGRFHAFSMFDDDAEYLETTAWLSSKDADSDSGTDVDYKPRQWPKKRSTPKIGFGVRADVMLLWEELDRAREVLANIQAFLVEMEQPKKEQLELAKSEPVVAQEEMPIVQSRSELYMGSKEWLKIHGLQVKRLGFYQFLETVAFKHCDGVVDIPRTRASLDAEGASRPKLINARYCDRFAHVRWKDGRIMHVHLSGPMHLDYAQKLMATVDNYQKRLEWLQQGSRELFGTIIEDKVAILIDTSSSMASRLFIVKDKLYRLMQEQLRHKKKFNIIKYDSRVLPWREHLVVCSEQNLENSWRWVKGLTTGGSTNTLGALKRALSDTETEAVYLLTDGRPDQPPSTVIAQAHLLNSVPVHTISFNCADSEANEFLSKLAAETGGRYHYFSEDGYDEKGPQPYESEDIRLIREEIEQGLQDLEKVEQLREECTKLDWYGNENRCAKHHGTISESTKQRPTSSHGSSRMALVPSPPQVERPFSAQPAYKPRSRQTMSRNSTQTNQSSRGSPSREVAVVHTRSSELRMSVNSRQRSLNGWMLPESREYLQRRNDLVQSRQEEKKKKKKKKRKVSKPDSGLSRIQRWMKKNSLVAHKLTILDALAPTMIPHTTKYVPILDKHVLSKVFDQILPLAHASAKNKTEVQIINPQAVNLASYDDKLKKTIELYRNKLSQVVFQALSDDERLKYEGEGIPSFSENRKSMLADLEENDWPVSLKDIGILEREIEQAEIYLKQSQELRETSEKLARESAEKLKQTRESDLSDSPVSKPRVSSTERQGPIRGYRWSRNQRVIARSELDGFYYPGLVHKSLNPGYAEVDFDTGDRQVTPARYVIATGGSRPCPVLRVGDFVLARATIPRQKKDDILPQSDICYVPGIVQVTPLREKSALKCYTVIRYNGKKVTVIRSDMIKISRSRFVISCRYIREAEQTTRKGRSPVVVYPLSGALEEEGEEEQAESPGSDDEQQTKDKASASASSKSRSNKSSRRPSQLSEGSGRSSHSTQRSRSRSSSSDRSSNRSRGSQSSRASSAKKSGSRRSSTSSKHSVKSKRSNSPGIDLDFLEQTPKSEQSNESGSDDLEDKEKGEEEVEENEKKRKKRERKQNKNDKKGRKVSQSSTGTDSSSSSESRGRVDPALEERYSEQERKLQETQERLDQLQRQFQEEREFFEQQRQQMEERQKDLQQRQEDLLRKQLDDQQEEQRQIQREQRKLQEQQEDLLRKQREQQEHLLQQQYNQSQALHLQKQQVIQQEAKRLRDQETETERMMTDQMTETDRKQYRDVDTSPSQSTFPLLEREGEEDQEGKDGNGGKEDAEEDKDKNEGEEQVEGKKDDKEGQELADKEKLDEETQKPSVSAAEDITAGMKPAVLPQLKVFLDDDSEAFLLTKGSRGLLVSRQPPDEDPAVTAKRIPRPLQINDEVLARWPDDGWYYRGTIRQDCHDSSYYLEDSVGDLVRINRSDIISDDDDADNIINTGDPVIALHPSFPYGYAPGVVFSSDDTSRMRVRYYDGHEGTVPRDEVYLISAEKFERDCSYILACEDSLIGQAVVARHDKDGKFHLGSVRERVSGPRNYLIEWADQSLQIQNYAFIFGAHTKRHQLSISDAVLAICDQASFTYLPGKVTGTNGPKLSVSFCNGSTSSQVDPMQSFWISPDYHEKVVEYYRTCTEGANTN